MLRFLLGRAAGGGFFRYSPLVPQWRLPNPSTEACLHSLASKFFTFKLLTRRTCYYDLFYIRKIHLNIYIYFICILLFQFPIDALRAVRAVSPKSFFFPYKEQLPSLSPSAVTVTHPQGRN